MKFKLDENFGQRALKLFEIAGHDVRTALQESLGGATDRQIYEACRKEQRCLVTLDLDFSDITRFSPRKTGGIAVIRAPKNPSLEDLEALVRQLLRMLEQMPVENNLWIVEKDRIRVHQRE